MSESTSSSLPGVLHGVTLQAQPRMLKRPGAVQASAAMPQVAPALEEKAVYDKAYEEGLEKGQQAGFEAGMRKAMEAATEQIAKATQQAVQQNTEQAQQQIERLRALVQALQTQMQQHAKTSQDDTLALCFETLCRVFGQKAMTLEGIRQHVEETLQSWNGKALLCIHVHPQDWALLQAAPDHTAFLQTLSAHDRPAVQFVPDPEVKFGGCVLRSADGALDARLDVQLQIIRRALLQARVNQQESAAP